MKTYSVQEASEIAGIPTRTVHYICKRDNVRKVSNKYLITDELLSLWIDKKNEPAQLPAQLLRKDEELANLAKENNILINHLNSLEEQLKQEKDKKIESGSLLVQINQELKEENERLKQQITKEIPHQEKLKKAIELITLEAMKQNVTHKVFTEEEYTDIIGTISQVDFHQEQVVYLKNRIEKQDDSLLKLSKQVSDSQKIIQQLNFLSAKDKNYDI